jgi:hypothetical protein
MTNGQARAVKVLEVVVSMFQVQEVTQMVRTNSPYR